MDKVCSYCKVSLDSNLELSEVNGSACLKCMDRLKQEECTEVARPGLCKLKPARVDKEESYQKIVVMTSQAIKVSPSTKRPGQKIEAAGNFNVADNSETLSLLEEAMEDVCIQETKDAFNEIRETTALKAREETPVPSEFESCICTENNAKLSVDACNKSPAKSAVNQGIKNKEIYPEVSSEALLKEAMEEIAIKAEKVSPTKTSTSPSCAKHGISHSSVTESRSMEPKSSSCSIYEIPTETHSKVDLSPSKHMEASFASPDIDVPTSDLKFHLTGDMKLAGLQPVNPLNSNESNGSDSGSCLVLSLAAQSDLLLHRYEQSECLFSKDIDIKHSPKRSSRQTISTSGSPNNRMFINKELICLEERLHLGINELEMKIKKIGLGKSSLEYYFTMLKSLKNMSVENFKREAKLLNNNICKVETKFGLNRISNVSVSLADFNDRASFLNEIRKKIKRGERVCVAHDFNKTQLIGKVTLRNDILFLHAMSDKISGEHCIILFQDMKKCFRHSEDQLFLIYFSPKDQYQLALITLTNNPLNHQFIKLCTAEYGATYKGARFTQDIQGSTEACGTVVEVSEYMINKNASSGPIDYVTGCTWSACLPGERIVTGSIDGSFKIEKFPGSAVTEVLSVIGKVCETTNAFDEEDFIYVLDKGEQEKKPTIEDCGLALNF